MTAMSLLAACETEEKEKKIKRFSHSHNESVGSFSYAFILLFRSVSKEVM